MAEKEKQYPEMDQLREDLKRGTIGGLYLFFGDEHYLLQFYLDQLREKLLVPGTEEFNHRRLEGKNLTVRDLDDAMAPYPAFAEHTLIEVWDWNVFSLPEEDRLAAAEMLEQAPEHACLVLIFETEPFKPDKRIKYNDRILKCFKTVEFGFQSRDKLLRWVMNRSAKLGSRMDRDTAEYLLFVGGGSMTALDPEIAKLCAYSGSVITKEDIDKIVTPVVEAVAWRLTDALTVRRYGEAMVILGKLLEMQEPAHRILAAVSSELRRLLVTKLWLAEQRPTSELRQMGLFRYDFQIQKTVSAARSLSLSWCTHSVRLCSETAMRLNSEKADYEDLIREFVAELALG